MSRESGVRSQESDPKRANQPIQHPTDLLRSSIQLGVGVLLQVAELTGQEQLTFKLTD